MPWDSYEDVPGTPQDLQTGDTWRNWGQNQSARPAKIFHPASLDDLRAIVKEAVKQGKKIRVCGDGHSWSGLVPTDDFMVFVSGLHKVDIDKSDPARPLVRIESGATVRQVVAAMRAVNVALPSNVVLGTVQFGGLIATGCHGAGRDQKTLSDLVVSMEVVTGDAELRTFSADNGTSEEVMSAARLHLGLFGIIYRMTLRAVPAYNVRTTDQKLPMAAALDTVRDVVGACDYTEMFWFPFNDKAWLKTMTRTADPPTHDKPVDGFRAWLNLLDAGAAEGGFEAVAALPSLAKAWCPLAFQLVPEREEVETITDGLHYQKAINRLRMGNLEIAFAVDEDFGNFKQAWTFVLNLVDTLAARDAYPMNMAMNARFIKGSDVLLSPASGNPQGPGRYTCYIEILSYYRTPGWAAFEAQVGDEWMKLQNARPHWAKSYEGVPNIIARMRAAYGDRIQRFMAIRAQENVDPANMFVNPLLQKLFFDA